MTLKMLVRSFPIFFSHLYSTDFNSIELIVKYWSEKFLKVYLRKDWTYFPKFEGLKLFGIIFFSQKNKMKIDKDFFMLQNIYIFLSVRPWTLL